MSAIEKLAMQTLERLIPKESLAMLSPENIGKLVNNAQLELEAHKRAMFGLSIQNQMILENQTRIMKEMNLEPVTIDELRARANERRDGDSGNSASGDDDAGSDRAAA